MRFHLRTMLLVVLVLCTSLAWIGVQMKWIRDRQEVYPADVSYWPRKENGFLVGIEGNHAPWSIRFLGAPGFSKIHVMVNDRSHPTAQDQIALRNAKMIFPEAEVDFAE
jgi:hypothetical protein